MYGWHMLAAEQQVLLNKYLTIQFRGYKWILAKLCTLYSYISKIKSFFLVRSKCIRLKKINKKTKIYVNYVHT